jgi:hypothetical protein
LGVDAFDLPLRIVVIDPVPGVALALQKGKKTGAADLVPPMLASANALTFDFAVTVAPAQAGGPPRLHGPLVQGPPGGRFVYLNVGTFAGDAASCWSRRAKVPLSGLAWPSIEALATGERLEARIAGRARDGGPLCASVALLPPGWRTVRPGDD